MTSFLSSLFKSSILSSFVLVILGLLLIFESEATIISISYIIGGFLIAIGGLALIKFVKSIKEENKSELDTIYGTVTIILGVIVIKNPQAIASIIPFIVGFIIIINSANKLQYSIELKKNKNDLWKSTMIIAFVTTICGVALILNPFKGAEFLTKIVGILILVYAVLDIISTLTIKNTVKKIHSAIEESVNEAQVVDEEDNLKSKKNAKSKSKKNTKES